MQHNLEDKKPTANSGNVNQGEDFPSERGKNNRRLKFVQQRDVEQSFETI